jgi:hypothetical protein
LLKRLPKNEIWCWLATAEKEIEQAFGRTHLGRQRQEANDGGSNKHAAQLALKGSVPNACSIRRNGLPLQHEGRAAKFSFTVIVDGKGALSAAHGKRHILRPSWITTQSRPKADTPIE